MRFSVYLPPQAESRDVPVLYWLSGLTCTEENFIQKSAAFEAAAKHGLMIVCPDTSPRGANIEGEESDWDFGSGAGFYLNATEPKWADNYNMYEYITAELPFMVELELPVDSSNQGISGHSMGGHGALVIGLRNAEHFKSISAFAPICSPSQCPWGEKAFSNYLHYFYQNLQMLLQAPTLLLLRLYIFHKF